ncbi:protein S100-A16 [Thalassophryne amazonica]|uniref:protein S100-A16 n=1 Tax=Thalassophryne amazonica TaxID=390379 RepID=UPI00147201EB|nr:protein S100-A16 [Thalassophryne amazonica]XP_034030668.1 protein S100-A16 [Thalassophryne amazonica]XP_034030669.1 protein S100-A16 [Thalassophryne amazonica]
MEDAIKTIASTYFKQCKGKKALDNKSFKKMVQTNLGNIMADTNSADAIKEMQRGLDENQDGKVSFEEYLTLIKYLATSLSEYQCGQSSVTS